jgi:hypothetical protein
MNPAEHNRAEKGRVNFVDPNDEILLARIPKKPKAQTARHHERRTQKRDHGRDQKSKENGDETLSHRSPDD